jgi:hypothetical protein
LTGLEYSYNAFGLRICSEIECEHLLPGSGQADVHISLGHVPDRLEDATAGGVLYQSTPGKFLLNIDRVARYLVSDGNEILIHPAPEADFDAIRLFLLGTAFGALLHQRGIFPLHGSAIVTTGGAVVFAGLSGCGKSTIAGAFHQRGYSVLADEICAVDTGDSLRVMPANPFLMLWADALREMGVDRLGLRPARSQIEKYILPLGDGFASEATRLRALYIVETTQSDLLSVPTPIKGFGKIEALARNTYRPHFVEHMNLEGEHLKQITAIAQRIQVRRIDRPRGPFRLGDLVNLLEEDFEA